MGRAAKRFEDAQEAERNAEIALTAAQRHREMLAEEVAQAQALAFVFEDLV